MKERFDVPSVTGGDIIVRASRSGTSRHVCSEDPYQHGLIRAASAARLIVALSAVCGSAVFFRVRVITAESRRKAHTVDVPGPYSLTFCWFEREASVKRILLALFCLILIPRLAVGQNNGAQGTATSQTSAEPPSNSSNFSSAKAFVLEDGTPVKMRINRTISSGDARVGDTVDFEVLEDITLNGVLVIPKGGLAFATVTEAQAKRRMARGGKLDINIDYVKLISSEKAALRAVKDMSGGGHTGAMVGGMVATSLVFFPAAPFFLFMHGKDTSIPKGTEVTAYINGDMKLDIAKFQPQTETQSTTSEAAMSVAPAASAKLQLESNPSGGDIEIDGSFVGNTPSDVQVQDGEHTITVKKSGFKDWKRKMKVTSGSSVHLNAELEKAEGQ